MLLSDYPNIIRVISLDISISSGIFIDGPKIRGFSLT